MDSVRVTVHHASLLIRPQRNSMAPGIIKQGTARAVSIKQYSFLATAGDSPATGQSLWPEVPFVPSVKKAATAAAPLSPAAVDTAQLEKIAFESGFRQGEKAALEASEKNVETAMKRYSEAIIEVNKLRSFLYAQVEREVVKLAVEVAKKIVHREINADPDIIQALMRVALDHVAEKSAVTIHLNPSDYGYLLEQHTEWSQTEGRNITLLADKSIERGGCFIRTDCGEIDARVEEKFQEVERAFFEGLK